VPGDPLPQFEGPSPGAIAALPCHGKPRQKLPGPVQPNQGLKEKPPHQGRLPLPCLPFLKDQGDEAVGHYLQGQGEDDGFLILDKAGDAARHQPAGEVIPPDHQGEQGQDQDPRDSCLQ